MSQILLFLLLLIPINSLASIDECYKEAEQSTQNECMTFERDLAIGGLMMEVTKRCADKDEVKDLYGTDSYPMLLDECMAKELNELSKILKDKKD